MATERRKLGHRRIKAPVPHWVARLKAGEPPERDSEEDTDLIGWYFFGDALAGMPAPESAEGRALWELRRANEA